jgi:hypothetical protein
MMSKEFTTSFLKTLKILSKEITKSLLKKSEKVVTVTLISRLFTDKRCLKVLEKASQNRDDWLKLAVFGLCDQLRKTS